MIIFNYVKSAKSINAIENIKKMASSIDETISFYGLNEFNYWDFFMETYETYGVSLSPFVLGYNGDNHAELNFKKIDLTVKNSIESSLGNWCKIGYNGKGYLSIESKPCYSVIIAGLSDFDQKTYIIYTNIMLKKSWFEGLNKDNTISEFNFIKQ